MLVSRVDPSSFSPKVELVGLLTALPIKACRILWNSRAQASLQHLLAFSGTSHILQLQLHISCISGFSTFCQQSKARKQCVQAIYRRPGLGVYGGTRLWLLEMFMHLKRKAPGFMSQRLCDLLQRLYRHVAQVVWSRN